MKTSNNMLDMVKHPPPTDVYVIYGVKCIFSYSITHLTLFAFTFTYLNITTLFEFTVYPSLMTGNFFHAALDMNATQYMDSLYRFVLIISCTCIGTCLDCYLLITMKSRQNVFAVLMCLLVLTVAVVDLIADTTGSRYSLCLLCVTSGALVHWSQKLGYTCSAMTGNMFKLSEIIFKLCVGYDLGGAKMHGEALILFGIFFGSLVGALSAVGVLQITENLSIMPLLVTVPFHLYLAGCLEEWGWITKADVDKQPTLNTDSDNRPGGVKLDNPSDVELANTKSPLSLDCNSSATVSGRESMSSAKSCDEDRSSSSSSVFQRTSITADELKDVEAVEQSFGYKVEKSLFIDD